MCFHPFLCISVVGCVHLGISPDLLDVAAELQTATQQTDGFTSSHPTLLNTDGEKQGRLTFGLSYSMTQFCHLLETQQKQHQHQLSGLSIYQSTVTFPVGRQNYFKISLWAYKSLGLLHDLLQVEGRKKLIN